MQQQEESNMEMPEKLLNNSKALHSAEENFCSLLQDKKMEITENCLGDTPS
jgi:hypothetical protein